MAAAMAKQPLLSSSSSSPMGATGRLYPQIDGAAAAAVATTTSTTAVSKSVTSRRAPAATSDVLSPEEARQERIRMALRKKGGWSEEDERRLREEGHVYVIPARDSALAVIARREAEAKRRRAESSDEIRVKNMGKLGVVRHTLARTIDPYTEHIPTVSDLVAAGQKMSDARRLYPDDYSSWAKLIEHGMRLEHFVRGVWWDVNTLVECYNVNWRMLATDIGLTAEHLIQQQATCGELVQLRIDVPALISMGMDNYWFKFAAYQLIMEWKKVLGLTKQHLLSDLNMFVDDFTWLINYRGWTVGDMTDPRGLGMTLEEINRRAPQLLPPPPVHQPMPAAPVPMAAAPRPAPRLAPAPAPVMAYPMARMAPVNPMFPPGGVIGGATSDGRPRSSVQLDLL